MALAKLSNFNHSAIPSFLITSALIAPIKAKGQEVMKMMTIGFGAFAGISVLIQIGRGVFSDTQEIIAFT